MNKIWIVLLFFCVYGSAQDISITIIDKDSPAKEHIIEKALELQESLLFPLGNPVPEENVKNGYLLIPTASQDLVHALNHLHAALIVAYYGDSLVGYAYLNDISAFTELYEHEGVGRIESTLIEAFITKDNIGYIEQMAVKPGLARMGIGKSLITTCKKIRPNGLIADVFLEPVTTEAALHFFTKQGFEKIGILHQQPRKDFPYAHRTQIFCWNPND
jgi:ribosomal protein S18 acetylase RimI-like enzyme